MLRPSDTPTRLLGPGERPGLRIREPKRASAFRSAFVVWRFIVLAAATALLVVTRRSTTPEFARRARDAFEDIGGLWLRFGQLLSLRIDVFPAELCRELARLEVRPDGFPGELARAIVETELGAPIDLYFEEFDDTPFATVPLGQVHRAKLRREAAWVAVKVQLPFTRELFARDLRLLRFGARLFTWLRFRLHLRWQEGVAELEEIMSEELDFRFEASEMRRMKKTLSAHGIVVPQVFSIYCTPRVLVSEFIHAVPVSDYLHVQRTAPERVQAWLVENDIDPRQVAHTLFDSLFRQILEDNLYHGDLRPANIVLLRHSRVGLIDFRTVNFTEREYLQKYRLFIRALATRDYAKAADIAFMLSAILPRVDVEAAKEKVIRALRAWATRTVVKELPYHERSIDHATAEVVRVLYAYRCTMEWFWLRIHRAMSTLDESLAVLAPDLNHTKRALRYFRRANERSARALATGGLFTSLVTGARSALDIQERVSEFTMFQGSIIRRNALVFQASTNKVADALSAFVGMVAFVILGVGVAIAGVLAYQNFPEATRGILGGQLTDLVARVPRLDGRISAALLVVDVLVFTTFRRLKHRLGEKDVRSQERAAVL